MSRTNLEIIVDAKDNASGVLGRLGGGLSSLAGIAAGVAVAGFAALGAGIASSINEAMKAQDGLVELETVIESTGGVAGVTTEKAQALASSLEAITRFSDDTILSAESMLLTFTNIGKDVFPMATEMALNLAQKFGGADQAALMLGKALNDPVEGLGALKRAGAQFTAAQEEMIQKMVAQGDIAGAQKVILGELGTEFGGLAVAAGSTAAGKLDIFWNKLGNVQEQIGGAFLPVIGLAADKLSAWVDTPGFQAGVESITKGIGSIIEVITPLAEGNALLALQNLQHSLMSFGVDPKAIQAVTDLFTGNIFGTRKMTPGGMAETGGLLRSMGISDKDVATAETSIDTIVQKADAIGEAFSKIFAAGTGAGAEGGSVLVGTLKEIAWAMDKIAAAGDVAAQIRGIVDAVGVAGATDAILTSETGLEQTGRGRAEAQALGAQRFQPIAGAPAGLGGPPDWSGLIQGIVEALRGAPIQVSNQNQISIDGKKIADVVSTYQGENARMLGMQGGHASLR